MPASTILSMTGLGSITFTHPASIPAREKIERAIVEHEIPTKEYDIAEDMGGHNLRFHLTGLCTSAQKATLKSMASATQIGTQGKCTLTMTDDSGTQQVYLTQLAIKSAEFEYGELVKLWRYAIEFIRTNQPS